MNKMIWLPVIIIIMLAALSSGCISSSSAATSGTAGTSSAIAITYTSVFTGQTASGNLKLEVDMTIENRGYESFKVSQKDFAVKVNQYSYDTAQSEFLPADIPDGGRAAGKMTFQVPAVAATSRVGYQMEYTGPDKYNVQWLKQSGSSNSASGNPVSNPAIKIAYQGNYMWVKDTSSLYLLVDLIIENKGYESFNTSPRYFSLLIGNIFGKPGTTDPIYYDGDISNERDGAYSDLRAFDLQNGGKITGTLAFQVPKNILASTESYRINYSGVRTYNIEWSQIPIKETK